MGSCSTLNIPISLLEIPRLNTGCPSADILEIFLIRCSGTTDNNSRHMTPIMTDGRLGTVPSQREVDGGTIIEVVLK